MDPSAVLIAFLPRAKLAREGTDLSKKKYETLLQQYREQLHEVLPLLRYLLTSTQGKPWR
jgi:hypothetical protein